MMRKTVLCLALFGSTALAQTAPPPVTVDQVNGANAAAVAAVVDAISKQGAYIQQQLADQQAQLANLQARAAVEDAPPVVSNFSVAYDAAGRPTLSWDTNKPTQDTVSYYGGGATARTGYYSRTHAQGPLTACPNGQGNCTAFITSYDLNGQKPAVLPTIAY